MSSKDEEIEVQDYKQMGGKSKSSGSLRNSWWSYVHRSGDNQK